MLCKSMLTLLLPLSWDVSACGPCCVFDSKTVMYLLLSRYVIFYKPTMHRYSYASDMAETTKALDNAVEQFQLSLI